MNATAPAAVEVPHEIQVHPTAIVDPQAQLGPGVVVGPFCIIRGDVKLGAGVRLMSHVVIQGPTTIGPGTVLYPNACIGLEPQDYKFKPGMPTAGVVIGRDCLIREGVTVHAATKVEKPTSVGDRVFMMANSHVGHDARAGNDSILVNGALMAGHSELQDKAILSGNAAIHQFNRVGRMAMVSGGVVCPMDVPPFCVAGLRNKIHGLNLVGLRRNGVSRDDISKLHVAYREVLRTALPRKEMIARLEELGKDCELVMEQARFVATAKRPVARAVDAETPEELG